MTIKELTKYIGVFNLRIFAVKAIRRMTLKNNSKISWKINNYNEQIITTYLQDNVAQKSFDIENYVKPKKKIVENPVWIMWWQGEDIAPDIVKVCINSIKKNCQGGKVYIVNQHNIFDYIDLPEFIQKKFDKGVISRTHLSDLIRLQLLSTYGGVWIDATVFLHEKIENDFFENEFFTIKFGVNTKDPSHGRWTTFLMEAKPHNVLMERVFMYHLIYWMNYDVLIDYIMFDYFVKLAYINSQECRELIDSVNKNNIDVFKLRKVLSKPWMGWDALEIDRNTGFFKLSWKEKFEELINENEMTVYGYLKKYYLSI